MKQVIVLRLKDAGVIDEYERRHDEIWPELVREFAESGISEMEIFVRGNEVIIYSETSDPNSWQRLWASSVHKRWDREMSVLLEYDGDNVKSETLRHVFSLADHRSLGN
ncbi:MAG: L-rhamnose mutarotase [Ferrimicrobium acidiphilum]